MSVYGRQYWCPADDCGGDVIVPYHTPETAIVICRHCLRAYALLADGDHDGRGWRDTSTLVPATH